MRLDDGHTPCTVRFFGVGPEEVVVVRVAVDVITTSGFLLPASSDAVPVGFHGHRSAALGLRRSRSRHGWL